MVDPKISVITVSWNVAGALKRCLASLQATKYSNLEIIVIDNASSDSSAQFATIKNDKNLGFPKAANIGLKNSTGDYIVLLNPDTTLQKDFFVKSLDFLNSHSDAGLMGPKYTNPDGSPQPSVFHEPSIFGSNEKYVPGKISSVDTVTFACVIFPRSTLEKVGLLTERVFMYYEDFDYCRRVRRSGLKVYFNPEISIIHEHGQSAKVTSHDKYRFFVETLIYPLRVLLNTPNTIPSSARYLNESAIWYNGWPKQVLITFINWVSQKIKS